MVRKHGPGRGHRLPYRQKVVGLRVHPNVDVLLDELAEQADMNRNAYFTALIAEKAGKTLEEILTPDDDQEALGKTA
ncbi:hypothetical protein ACH498_25050 [Rhodococcus erythropolis]|jgi:hypothetical protein|uniref:hypothetical protein n=1 Tax=Nocardia nova TaxID=37330 RepID=UPI0018935EEE|nr:hypothetical protein [Nocardia nova]MBF6278063.1 hypothetical protein [Nocardia nova]